MALSASSRMLAKRMDMVISAGSPEKNVDAYVLLPPDSRTAIDLLIQFRAEVGIAASNPYIFARMRSDTPFTGNTELRELATSCPAILHPERISSNHLRKYIATVSQILDMSDNETEKLATHLGHDPKTHKENYRLSHSTRELSVVSQLLLLVESGAVNKWKGKKLSEIPIEGKRKSWSLSEVSILRKKFYRYLQGFGQVHKADLIHCQNICVKLSKRSLAQIRSKLNNMKLGKSC